MNEADTVGSQTPDTDRSRGRRIALNALAVVGFVALSAAGLALAVYSARFVPDIVNRLGAAAVYLGSTFSPGTESPDAGSSVATTTIPGGNASGTDTTTVPVKPKTRTKNAITPGPRIDTTYPIGGSLATSTPFGLSDLTVQIQAVGYLTDTTSGSFVASGVAPLGTRPAIRFSIKNIGTNVTGTWRFRAILPTPVGFVFESQPQQSLNPGDRIEYTLGFDQANRGANRTITVTVNFDRSVAESNLDNNSASAQLTIWP